MKRRVNRKKPGWKKVERLMGSILKLPIEIDYTYLATELHSLDDSHLYSIAVQRSMIPPAEGEGWRSYTKEWKAEAILKHMKEHDPVRLRLRFEEVRARLDTIHAEIDKLKGDALEKLNSVRAALDESRQEAGNLREQLETAQEEKVRYIRIVDNFLERF